MNYYEILKNEPLFWTRIGLGANPDIRNEKGEITFINDDWSDFIEEHKAFLGMGVKIQTTVIHSGWVGENEYDYSATDKTLDTIFSLSDDVLYLPRVELNAPLEWLKSNPDEIAISSYADRNPQKIAEVYKNYRTAHEIAAVRCGVVNEHGVYLQSFFSDKWMKDAKEALRRFVHHLENGKYGSRIVGYQVAFGMCGEICNWGAWKDHEHWGDFSKPAQKGFAEYCKSKYGSISEAAKTYNIPHLNENDIVPLPDERFKKNCDIYDYFRVNDSRAIDFSLCLSERSTKNICDFAKTVKEEVDKPVGSFYGYLVTKYPTETSHIAIERLMECEYIDFLSAPKIYYRCGAGQPGGSQATSMSVAMSKIWLDELDNDTHISKMYQEESNHPKTFSETKTILWREVAKNLAWNNQNFWWMDLYGGWFMDKEIQNEFKKIIEFNKNMRKLPRRSISEILFVMDETSLAHQTADRFFTGCRDIGILNEMGAEIKLCGAPVDEYRLKDLKKLDLTQYKMIVFANAFVVDDETIKIIKSIPETTLLVWNYAAGIRNEDNFEFANTENLTGIKIAPHEKNVSVSNGYGAKTNCPPLKICKSEGTEVIERYNDGEIKIAKFKNNLLTVSPGFYAKDFHELAKSYGCRMFTTPGCAVFADNRFTGIFPGGNGAKALELDKNLKDLISGKASDDIFELAPNGTYIFL